MSALLRVLAWKNKTKQNSTVIANYKHFPTNLATSVLNKWKKKCLRRDLATRIASDVVALRWTDWKSDEATGQQLRY